MNTLHYAAGRGPGLYHPARSDSFAAESLPDHLLAEALNVGRDRRQRRDGWTPPRIRAFLDVLARTGAVAKAARAAGMSRQSAYALRTSAKGQAFDDACGRALLMAAPSIPDELMERAINGYVEPVYRGGKLVGERHRHDNRLAMRLLRQLDRLETVQTPAARAMRAVQEDFDAYLDVVCAGDEEQVDAFLHARLAGHRRAATQTAKLSTLPAGEQPRRDVAQTPKLSTLPVPQTLEPLERQSSSLSALPTHQPSESLARANRFAARASPEGPRFAHAPPLLEEAA